MLLDRDAIRTLMSELGEHLEAQGLRGELFVVGGAAMALAYNTRRATRDIDAIFEPKQSIYEAARFIAERHPDRLDPDWLNDAVKGLLPGADPNATVAFEHPGLVVRVASPPYLFAMKVVAARVERDADDIGALFDLCGFDSVEAALDHVQHLYPHVTIEPRAQYLLEEVVAERG